MEDRHAVSEPRPVATSGLDGNLPAWEVDILRDDTVVVDTFELNNDVLPPRNNKKGKMIWRLPDSVDKLPSFGTEDRRRILDIFKERKKKRKQQKKKRHVSPNNGNNGGLGTGTGERRESPSTSIGGKGRSRSGGGRREGPGTDACERLDGSHDQRENRHLRVGTDTTNKGKELHKKENGKSLEHQSTRQDKIEDRHENGERHNNNKKNGRGEGKTETNGRICNIPQHSPSSPPSTPPPPGTGATSEQASKQRPSHSTQGQSSVPSTPDPSRMSLSDSRKLSTLPPPQPTHDPPLPPRNSLIDPLAPDALFVTVPFNERPEALPGQSPASLAVPAARHFVGIYYAHFGVFLPGAPIGGLIRYYTTTAQKSVSIGGAHSVVTGRKDIAAQLLNFAGTEFAVRGVVAQDAVDGKGVHILVTGTARTVGGVVASFAHSLSLVPINNRNTDGGGGDGICPTLLEALQVGYPFQIHNDALALLHGDSGQVNPTPIRPPMQMQQMPPPPPPGMF